MGKDWTGNGKSIFTTLGASNHTDKEREANDYYATDPIAIDALLSGGGRYSIIKCGSVQQDKDIYLKNSKSVGMMCGAQTLSTEVTDRAA